MLIQDLSKELDIKAMSAVRGGDNSNAAVNSVGQLTGLSVPVLVGVIGPANTNVHVDGTQQATIDSYQHAGDSFLALIPFGRVLK